MNEPPQDPRPEPELPAAKTAPANVMDEIAGAAPLEAADAQPDPERFKEEQKSLDEGRSLKEAKDQYEVDQLKQELKEQIDVHDLRQTYTGRLFWLTVVWLITVLSFVFLSGFKGSAWLFTPTRQGSTWQNVSWNLPMQCTSCWQFFFGLSDNVLIAFITSTTATVIGIFIIVAKWLFPSRTSGKSDIKVEKKDGE